MVDDFLTESEVSSAPALSFLGALSLFSFGSALADAVSGRLSLAAFNSAKRSRYAAGSITSFLVIKDDFFPEGFVSFDSTGCESLKVELVDL